MLHLPIELPNRNYRASMRIPLGCIRSASAGREFNTARACHGRCTTEIDRNRHPCKEQSKCLICSPPPAFVLCDSYSTCLYYILIPSNTAIALQSGQYLSSILAILAPTRPITPVISPPAVIDPGIRCASGPILSPSGPFLR